MKLLSLAVTASVLFATVPSYACSYVIDRTAKISELAEVVKAAVAKGDARVEFIQVESTDFTFVESRPTNMCPEELTYNADFTVTYNEKGLSESISRCGGVVKVTKIEPWGALASTADVQYKLSGLNLFRCTN